MKLYIKMPKAYICLVPSESSSNYNAVQREVHGTDKFVPPVKFRLKFIR